MEELITLLLKIKLIKQDNTGQTKENKIKRKKNE